MALLEYNNDLLTLPLVGGSRNNENKSITATPSCVTFIRQTQKSICLKRIWSSSFEKKKKTSRCNQGRSPDCTHCQIVTNTEMCCCLLYKSLFQLGILKHSLSSWPFGTALVSSCSLSLGPGTSETQVCVAPSCHAGPRPPY